MEDIQDQSLALPRLVGDTCNQVWFVRDYVMVRLGNTSITCVTDPQIEMSGGVTYEFPGAGSRDALCALIDKSVTSAVQFATGAVEIHFTEGLVLRVTPWADFPTREFIYIARI